MKKILFMFFIYASLAQAQQSSLSKGVNYISRFIASDNFITIKYHQNDLIAIDSLWKRALNFYDGNIDEALLALTFATVPYKKVPIQIPIFNWVVKYPLVSDTDSIFIKKNYNLPSKLFFDTPANDYGDKDKLAHFFGSAYISYQSNFFDLGDLIGYFVEEFEESFKVQSRIDNRDLFTNRLGNIFGEVLKTRKDITPSGILLLPVLNLISF